MKYLNFKTKILLVGLTLLIFGTTNNAVAVTAIPSVVNFSGYDWTVRGGIGGPGADNDIGNYWGDTDQDVFVDDSGYLHLKVSQHADDPDTEEDDPTRWYSSEVYLENSLGYGKYTFDINSRLDLIDQNLVAAPFLYQDDTHEIDIEHSYWAGETGPKNLFYNVQPYSTDGNQQSIAATFSDGVFQDIIDWQPDKIQFSTIQNGVEKNNWSYTGANNFTPGNERVHINFWQYNSLPPLNSTTNELIVSGFTFEPYVAPTTTPTSTPSVTATTSINLNIETSQESFSFPNLIVSACPETDGSATTTLSGMCALKQSGIATDWSTWGTDMFLNSVASYANDSINGIYWNWFNNLDYGQTALNKHLLTPNENLLLTYDVLPLRISVDTTTPAVGSTTTITLEQFGFDNFFNPTWTPATSSTLSVNGTSVSNDSGIYSLIINSIDPLTIFGNKIGFSTSSAILLSPTQVTPPSTVLINLSVQTSNESFSFPNLTVSACPETDGSATSTLNAMCALKQSGLTTDWSTWGSDMFLNSVSSYANDFANNIFWNWFDNLDYGQTALNKHILSNNENLLVTYDVLPLRIGANTTTPTVGTTSTITVEQFGFDDFFNPTWSLATSSTLSINSVAVSNNSGAYDFTTTSTNPLIIFGSKAGFVTSSLITLSPTSTSNSTSTTSTDSGNGGGGGSSITHNKTDIAKAVQYLSLNQNTDGSFGDSILYTDWAALALSTQNDIDAKSKVKQYLLSDPNFAGGLNPVSDLSRHSMALMSLGINPYTGTKTNFIQKIVDSFDGTQFGDSALYNDDIFAMIPLLKAGYTASDQIITKDAQFILSKQKPNGSWDGIDLTAAAVQALSPLASINGVPNALSNAKNYLKSAQNNTGGFGDVYGTAWTMQSISSLGEQSDNWLTNNKNPNDFLYSLQEADGGMSAPDTNSRIWATAYSIPAVLNKNWNEMLTSFSKPETTEAPGSSVTTSTTSTVVTTTIATTTPATTTIELTEEEPEIKPVLLVAQPTTDATLPSPTPTTENNNVSGNNFTPSQTQEQLTAGEKIIDSSSPIDDLPLDTPTRRTAKKVLAVTGGSAVALGAYLGLRLLRNVL